MVGWLKILVTAQVLGFGIWDLYWTLDLGLSINDNGTRAAVKWHVFVIVCL